MLQRFLEVKNKEDLKQLEKKSVKRKYHDLNTEEAKFRGDNVSPEN